MPSRGELQKQFYNILAEAKAHGYKVEDVIPKEVQDHFQEMAELKAAREYIKEVEDREKALQIENNNMLVKLKAKEEELENQPEEFKTLKVDLQQAQRSIDFYQELAENATERAQRYQQKMAETLEKQTATDGFTLKIARLQADLNNQQTAHLKLVKENAKAAEVAEKQREQDLKIIEEQCNQLAALTSHANEVETESEQFSETFSTLIDTLESEHSSVAAAVNDKTMRLRRKEELYSAIISEITPLNSFFDRAFSILGIYQHIFQTLSDPSSNDILGLPRSLDTLMDGAASDLYIYQNVHQTLDTGGLAEEQVRVQLDGIATNAGRMYNSLDCIRDDVATFLGRLRSEPNAWLAMKAKFGVASKMKRFSLG